jgi:thymidine phosphorylase
VDPAAGIELARVVGERVAKGEPLAYLCASRRATAEAQLARAERAFRIGSRAPRRRLIVERLKG